MMQLHLPNDPLVPTLALVIPRYGADCETLLFWAPNGKKLKKFNTEKVAYLTNAQIQSKDVLIAHSLKSSLSDADICCHHELFHNDGPSLGDLVTVVRLEWVPLQPLLELLQLHLLELSVLHYQMITFGKVRYHDPALAKCRANQIAMHVQCMFNEESVDTLQAHLQVVYGFGVVGSSTIGSCLLTTNCISFGSLLLAGGSGMSLIATEGAFVNANGENQFVVNKSWRSYLHGGDCYNMVEVAGELKLEPIGNIDVKILNFLGISSFGSNGSSTVTLSGFFLTRRKLPLQGCHEQHIFYAYLPGSKIPAWFSLKNTGSSISVTVPSNFRIQALSVCSMYALCNNPIRRRFNFSAHTIISNMTKSLIWSHCPKVFGIPEADEDMMWLSYWKFENQLGGGDELNISVVGDKSFQVKEVGVHLVYKEQEEKSSQSTSEEASQLQFSLYGNVGAFVNKCNLCAKYKLDETSGFLVKVYEEGSEDEDEKEDEGEKREEGGEIRIRH
ncbi:hypothetical protein TEA_016779 [Camellia sinensis var. sinensis]|uniref:C-JID domain-containing protein n=1 Tax=Camellia sinensis var. sinensis TaxID=542762 RepID=A0A4S4ECU4_CAMSN|nr:hypothetical protein TEA_016779 [Camellia sinensis var. sinensis]